MSSVEEMTISIAKMADFLFVSESTIYRWIREGKLKTNSIDGILRIPVDGNREFVRGKIDRARNLRRLAWVPKEIRGYGEWHEILDEFCWLFKVCYSSRESIKRKSFRQDQLFANYIQFHQVTLRKVGQAFRPSTSSHEQLVTDDLKRAWYNELAYAVPLRESTLGLSFSDIEINKHISGVRFAFPSWRIIMAYYSFYFYLRAITLQKQGGFRLQEHGAAISTFKHSVLQPLQRTLWKFPLDIAYTPGGRIYRKDLLMQQMDHLRYKYASHPRAPHRTPLEIFEHIYGAFRRKSRARSKPIKYTFFDYLHDFRVWANYLDIDNLLSLWGPGYKSFIDQNLAFLLFVVGGISELCYMSVLGTEEYVEQLQSLYDLFATNNPQLEGSFANTPLYQRLLVYNELGIARDCIKLKRRPNINQVIVLPIAQDLEANSLEK